MKELSVGPGTQVTLHFALSLDDGSQVDSNFEHDPAVFSVGDGSMLYGFEQAIFGLKAGDEQTFLIKPEQGFGARNPSNIQIMDRHAIPEDVPLEQGLVLMFADVQQQEIPGVVTQFDDDSITVDFNHPLAGRDINFSVKIIDVEPIITH